MRSWSLRSRCLVGLTGVLLLSSAFNVQSPVSWVASAQAQEPDALEGADATKTTTTPAKQESQLAFFYNALGLRYTIAFLFLSFVFVALIVMNIMSLRRSTIVPPELIAGFEGLLNEKRYQEAYDLAKNDESFLGKVLAAGLAKLQDGYPQAIEAMQEVGEDETMKLEHKLNYIALIGTISPMVGLLGTVDGMVAAFQVIARSDTSPKPSELAQGISMALITTLVGLWLAIPAIAIFGIFRNFLARLVLEVGIHSERLMGRFQNLGAKKP
jgi:biopolymer transport protein ExbB